MLNIFNNAFNKCQTILINQQKIVVAVSGGIDSLSLVLLVNEWCKKYNIKVVGLTVDHKLRPTSTEEALYINNLLIQKFNIEHHILTWTGSKPESNIEAIAREKRYELIFNFCKENNINVILLGHHLQDQVENFFIRLFRGSGIKGLSSMKKISKINNIYLVRPFLELNKEDLKEYLLSQNINWVEDESNNDEKYLRNKIRIFLNSFENKNDIINRIDTTINTIQAANNIIENEIKNLENKIYCYNNEYNFYKITFNEFIKLNTELQYRIINLMTTKINNTNETPRFQKFKTFISAINNFEKFKKYTLNNCVFEKINSNEFVCYKEYNSIKNKVNYLKKGELNSYLKYLKLNNKNKYKKVKNFKGYLKEILYTIPLKNNNKYII